MWIKKTSKSAIVDFFKKNYYIFILALPFLLIDACMRFFGHEINYFRKEMVFPNILFVVSYITLFVGIAICFKSRFGKIWYSIIFGIYYFLFMVNGIYFELTDFFFGFNLLLMADEGSAYVWDTIINTKIHVWAMLLVVLLSFLWALKVFPYKEKGHRKAGFRLAIGFVIVHAITPVCLGFSNTGLEWDTWRNPHNVYDNFNDANKCMKICGIYEYAVRDFYVTFLKPKEKEDQDEIAFLEDAYSELHESTPNAYTGIYEGKNVIFLQLEGIDDWLLNETDMPNLYGLLNESKIFNNHYSYYNGGGSTFNSELALNTGLITPITYIQNAYSFNTNLYEYSLANLFKNLGYRVNAFHMNTGEYYSRGSNYKNWGYDHYYSLLDDNSYDDLSYELDRELIENEGFYQHLFQEEGPFVHYLITYTNHKPFRVSKGMGKMLAELKYGEGNVPDLTEEACVKLFAGETDYMIGLMMQALKDNGLYENTVIVAFTDHYLYTIEDKTILEQYKETENNLINHTPFFIWSAGQEREEIDAVNGQIDILPTVLNMFGIKYIKEYYIGHDIFDADYPGYVFFSDGSWYNGTVYNDGQESEANDEEREINDRIDFLIKRNDLTLKYDYLRRIKN